MLTAGDKAPGFQLPDSDMHMIQSSDIIGKKNLVLYFYPKDNTTGCTIESIELSDLMADFERNDAIVVGISRDNCVSHAAFRDEHGLTVLLLADTDGEVCEQYGVWQEREAHGKKRMGIVRSTFIIDKSGTIRHALYDVKPKGHAAQVLKLVEAL